MARISGVNLPLNKRAEIGLTYIYGVGLSTSQKLLDGAGVSRNTYIRDLTEDEVIKLRDAIASVTVAASRSAGSAPRPTPALVRVRVRHRSPTRKRFLSNAWLMPRRAVQAVAK
jgi:ribosomal protein S13